MLSSVIPIWQIVRPPINTVQWLKWTNCPSTHFCNAIQYCLNGHKYSLITAILSIDSNGQIARLITIIQWYHPITRIDKVFSHFLLKWTSCLANGYFLLLPNGSNGQIVHSLISAILSNCSNGHNTHSLLQYCPMAHINNCPTNYYSDLVITSKLL